MLARDGRRCARADVDFVTIGQYLRPTPAPRRGRALRAARRSSSATATRRARGASCSCPSSPLTRSSYHADEDFERLRSARAARGAAAAGGQHGRRDRTTSTRTRPGSGSTRSTPCSSTRAPERAHFLIEALIDKARRSGAHLPYKATTAYVNTIHVNDEEQSPGRAGPRVPHPLDHPLERARDGRAGQPRELRARRPHRELRVAPRRSTTSASTTSSARRPTTSAAT